MLYLKFKLFIKNVFGLSRNTKIFLESIYIYFALKAIYRFQLFCELKILRFYRGTKILKLKILPFFFGVTYNFGFIIFLEILSLFRNNTLRVYLAPFFLFLKR